jgi:hypothetical protein
MNTPRSSRHYHASTTAELILTDKSMKVVKPELGQPAEHADYAGADTLD